MDDIEEAVNAVKAFTRTAVASSTWCHVLALGGRLRVAAVMEELGLVTRFVRGRKMRTPSSTSDEVMAAWQFDDICGRDCSACFRDGLNDLHFSWPDAPGFVMVVTDPALVLADPDRYYGLDRFVDELRDAQEYYAYGEQDRAPGDPLLRGPLSFDVVLLTDAEHRDEVVRRWRAAGAPISD